MDPFPSAQPSPDVLPCSTGPAVRITTVVAGRAVLVVVEGECDLAAAPVLEAAAAALPLGVLSVALDLSGLEFLDWTGLESLLALARPGVTPVLLDPSRAVRCLLDAVASTGLVPEGLRVLSTRGT